LSKDFGYLLAIALVVAIPVGLYFQHKWLAGFAYRAEISVWLFILAGLVNIVLAFITIAYHCVRASNINPVETLRSE
jgi:putative ABC transport system permease protein